MFSLTHIDEGAFCYRVFFMLDSEVLRAGGCNRTAVTEPPSSMCVDIPTALEVFLCFETKRNDISRKHPHNTRVISAEELGTVSKNITYMGDSLSYLDNLLVLS